MLDLPDKLSIGVDFEGISLDIKWKFDSVEAAKAAFDKTCTMLQNGNLTITLDQIKVVDVYEVRK